MLDSLRAFIRRFGGQYDPDDPSAGGGHLSAGNEPAADAKAFLDARGSHGGVPLGKDYSDDRPRH